jgi:membrane-anchored glycerophosphoryl diester phosphodiesterase (GDPDase)
LSDLFTNILTVAVLGYMGVRLVTGARVSRTAEGRSLVRRVRRNVGWRHIWPVPLVLGAILLVAYPLLLVPGLDWGWWSALGGDGNPVFGSSQATAGTVWEWLVPLVFVCLLIPALPLFAHAEERLFRAGAEDWSKRRRLFKVVQFGLVHALIGIPVGVALALSLGGAYFMTTYLHSYRRTLDRTTATIESTTAHTVYNLCIVLLVLVALVVDAVV